MGTRDENDQKLIQVLIGAHAAAACAALGIGGDQGIREAVAVRVLLRLAEEHIYHGNVLKDEAVRAPS